MVLGVKDSGDFRIYVVVIDLNNATPFTLNLVDLQVYRASFT